MAADKGDHDRRRRGVGLGFSRGDDGQKAEWPERKLGKCGK
jgi:hypothetical protein